MDNPYKILGLTPSATKEEVKKAYRQLAQQYHPDTGIKADSKQFSQISEAYRLLKDVDSKQKKEIESKKEVSVVPPKQNLYQERIDPKRKKQQKAFYQAKFRQGVLKVVGLSLLFGSITYFFGEAMGTSLFFDFIAFFLGRVIEFFPWMGLALGLLFGILFGSKRFFDLESFLTPRQLTWHQWGYRVSFTLLGAYLLIPVILVLIF